MSVSSITSRTRLLGTSVHDGEVLRRWHWSRSCVTLVLASLVVGISISPASAAPAASQPVAMAAPYEYLGWGHPQPPANVIRSTGVHDLTLAFILGHNGCNPQWDGQRPLLGGSDQQAITSIRNAGGDVDVSFGGWSGKKLGIECTTVPALVSAYETVINDYDLSAIDVDIEHTEFTQSAPRERVIEALAELQNDDPDLEITITFGTNESGPDSDGEAMITQAAALGFQPYAWTIMPFDFGTPVRNMAKASIEAANGLEADLASAYDETAAEAFAHVGISSMNGDTDDSSEIVSIANFEKILAFAQSEHLARLTFWAVNRDRQCTGGLSTSKGSCSGIDQSEYAFTDLVSQFNG